MMKRDITSLTDKVFDLLIVGGGIFAAAAAWDAALRGLCVALIEKQDFCWATSANHFKMVHGGIRYLQHGDIYRIRESCKERTIFLRTAPHLVYPLPIVIPTYGHGKQGKELLAMGTFLYDLIVFDRNRGVRDPARKIPWGRTLSRQDILRLFPSLEREDLTGGVIFHDAQMYNPTRLVVSMLRSAAEAGANVCNYMEAIDFLFKGNRVLGVQARDTLTKERLEIRAKVVLNATGPWADGLLRSKMGIQLGSPLTFSRDTCFVIPRQLTDVCALAVQGKSKDPDAKLSRSHRHLFLVPWREFTLVGVWHVVYQESPDAVKVTEGELQAFLDEINEAYPAVRLHIEDVSLWNAGLVLFGENKSGAANLSYGKRSILVDHKKLHQIEGLVTLIGVRATTARGMAERAIDLVSKKVGKGVTSCRTNSTAIYGGQIESFEEFKRDSCEKRPFGLGKEIMSSLIHNYGSEYNKVLRYINEKSTLAEPISNSKVLKAEVIHAIREEMAQKLEDVVFRRTDLGTAFNPGSKALRTCAELMAAELEWDENQLKQEISQVRSILASREPPNKTKNDTSLTI